MAARIERAWRQGLRRGRPMYPTHGLLPSPYVLRLEGETVVRRVYEDWNLYRRGRVVPWMIKIKEEVRPLTPAERRRVVNLAKKELVHD